MSTPRSLTLPPGVVRTTIATARGEVAALTTVLETSTAATSPVVLLVPGWTGSKEDFAEILPLIAETGRRAVAIDQRGQFETAGPDDATAYTLDELARDVLAVAAALSPSPVDLLGHSLGGLVAGRAAALDPLVVGSLVLMSSGTGPLPPEHAPGLRQVARSLERLGAGPTWDAMRAHEAALGQPAPPEPIERWMRRRFCASNPVALRALTMHLVEADDHRARLRDIPVPTLVVTGTDDDRWPVREQTTVAGEIGAEVCLLDGVGHSPAVEDPASTARALVEFWSRWAPSPYRVSAVLRGESADVPLARRLVREHLADAMDADRLDDAELLTSELVTNAIIHARPPVRLRAEVRGGHAIVVVSDHGGGPEAPRVHHGRGLSLVLALAHRCGSWTTRDGTTVWFWLPLDQPAGGPACSSSLMRSKASHGFAAGPTAMPSGHASR